MRQIKIYAGPISNLSDARYFAARGVDVLIYKVGYDDQFALSQEAYAAISDWVEVPGEVLWTSRNQEGKLKVHEEQFEIVDTFDHYGDKSIAVVDLTGMTLETIRDYRYEIERFAGVLIRGGDEEKVGVKSFEELDELMDLVDEIKKP